MDTYYDQSVIEGSEEGNTIMSEVVHWIECELPIPEPQTLKGVIVESVIPPQ